MGNRTGSLLLPAVVVGLLITAFSPEDEVAPNGSSAGPIELGTVSDDRSPNWPFSGVIVYSSNNRSVQYLDTRNGRLDEVSIGSNHKLSSACVPTPAVTGEGVELRFYDVGSAVLHIPWNDLAYPLFVSLLDGTSTAPESLDEIKAIRLARIGDTHDLLASNGNEFRVYREMGSEERGSLVALGEGMSGEQVATTLAAREAGGQSVHLSDILIGTDGSHYGFRFIYDEPACPSERIYIVDGKSGNVIFCAFSWGGGMGGPVLVSSDDLASGDTSAHVYVLPTEITQLECRAGASLSEWALLVLP